MEHRRIARNPAKRMLCFMVVLHPSVIHQYSVMSEATPAVSQTEHLLKFLN